jgi:SPP1 gp7 family putative phage head morphogenesis protein
MRKEKVLRAVQPNCGIERGYRRRLQALIEEMARSYLYWIKACWRRKPPVMSMDAIAGDASPSVELNRALKRLGRQWSKRFNEAAPQLAAYFALAANKRSDAVLRKILRDAGISVEFKMSAAMRDILSATLAENVGLIRSIPQQFHGRIEGMVMRSVQTGRDLEQLAKDLQRNFRVTRDRAELISRDQNNKATSAMNRARQEELGIEDAIWLHSHAGKVPRKTHLANHGKRYKVTEGWYDPDPKVQRHIWPGELINCRCVSRSVVKGFS